MEKIILLLVALFLSFVAKPVIAADPLIFDSTDNYLGGCQLTDMSSWELKEDLTVTTFQLWYKWDEGEKELPVTVTKDGKPFAEFVATRSQCDPYQKSWCNADFPINTTLTKGTYQTNIPNARQCLKPNGTGAVRLYGTKGAATDKPAAPTTTVSAPSITTSPIAGVQNPKRSVPCSCTNSIIIAVIVSSIITAIGILLLKTRKK